MTTVGDPVATGWSPTPLPGDQGDKMMAIALIISLGLSVLSSMRFKRTRSSGNATPPVISVP
jgi:hypothetical protein